MHDTGLGSPIIEIRSHISNDTKVHAGAWLRAGTVAESTQIASRCFVGFLSHLRFAKVGEGSMLASRVNLHGTPESAVVLGQDVWLGTNVTVTRGVTIGDRTVVGAGSLVTDNIPQDVVAVGRPARIISRRNAIDDGHCDPSPVLEMVRRRVTNGEPSFLVERTLVPARALSDAGLCTWRIATSSLVDAELSGGANVQVGENCILVGRSSHRGGLCASGGICLADNVSIGDNVILEGAGGLVIAERCVVESNVTIVTSTHDYRFRSLPWVEAPVVIGAACVIGHGAVIVGPVRIGSGVEIAPYSVVIRNVPAGQRTTGVTSLKEISR